MEGTADRQRCRELAGEGSAPGGRHASHFWGARARGALGNDSWRYRCHAFNIKAVRDFVGR